MAISRSLAAAISQVEAIIGKSMKNPSLLAVGLSHPSYQKGGDFKRFAFIGDGALGSCVSEYFVQRYPLLTVSAISSLMSDNVSDDNFARLVVQNGLEKYFHHRDPALSASIPSYVRSLAGGPFEPVPKVLGTYFEAIAGAYYMDCGRDECELWRVFEHLFQPLVIKPSYLVVGHESS